MSPPPLIQSSCDSPIMIDRTTSLPCLRWSWKDVCVANMSRALPCSNTYGITAAAGNDCSDSLI